MARIVRRRFLKQTLTGGGLSLVAPRCAIASQISSTPNEQINLAVIGVGWRGGQHVKSFCQAKGCQVRTVCDADETLVADAATQVEQACGARPRTVRDLRRIFDDPGIDAVSIATPNHWHALAAIWAMQAGKDVYVEKPVSHTVPEGRRIVQAARKCDRICQTGTQWRSYGATAATVEYIQQGRLGEVNVAHCLVYKRRRPIGPPGEYPVPKSVDYDLWTGPAPMQSPRRPKFHYDWHWFWDYGNGELANSGVHRVDLARMVLGLTGLGRAVMSCGGRLGYAEGEDGGQTPNTQLVFHDFGEKTIIQEVRGLETAPYRDCENGVIFHGTEGSIVLKRGKAELYDPQDRHVGPLKGTDEDHFVNFLDAVRSRRPGDLTAEILEGHQSSALAHVGNISQRLGRPATPAEIAEQLDHRPLPAMVLPTLGRLEDHVAANHVDPAESPLRLGPWLRLDSDTETFVDSSRAEALLAHPYREPFVVPEEDAI